MVNKLTRKINILIFILFAIYVYAHIVYVLSARVSEGNQSGSEFVIYTQKKKETNHVPELEPGVYNKNKYQTKEKYDYYYMVESS